MRRLRNPLEFVVYHADHGINPEQMAYIQAQIAAEDPKGFFIKTIQLPRALGTVRNALYGPASGDAPVSESEVDYRPRGDRPWSDRVVSWPTRPVNFVQALGMPDQKDPNKIALFTVYGGPLAPQHPDDPSNRDVAGSKKFWAEHALSIEQWAAKSNPSGLDRRAFHRARPQLTRRAAVREQVAEMSDGSGLPEMADLVQKRKVVIGPKGYGSPDLTPQGERAFKEITGEKFDRYETPRHHPAFVWLAENRPHFFFQYGNKPGFRLIDVPGGVYEVREYDGFESFYTPESVQWVRIDAVRSNPKPQKLRYTGDWHDLARAYGIAIPDEDDKDYPAAVEALRAYLMKNRRTLGPELQKWVLSLGNEASKVGDVKTVSLAKRLYVGLAYDPPKGVQEVAKNLTLLWV
jgi:hypothetical protein